MLDLVLDLGALDRLHHLASVDLAHLFLAAREVCAPLRRSGRINLPTPVAGGAEDHVLDQRIWAQAPGFASDNIVRRTIEGAAHFPRTESPGAVRDALGGFTARLDHTLDQGRSQPA